jgi:hypothetical protein
MTLDAATEFETPEGGTPAETPAAKTVAEPPVDAGARAELAQVKQQLQASAQELNALKSDAQIISKLKEVFGDKGSIDPRDAYVRKEITRLLPELQDLGRIKQLLPAVLETLGASYEEKVAERADTAVDFMKGHMKDAGLDPNDDDAVGYMEEVLTREIKANPELRALWGRGNVKAAVSKAFDKASGKLFAPVRARVKRSAVDTITGSPKASPRGSAPSPAAAKTSTVDPADSSRAGRSAVHDAAFDRLQELLDR